MNRTDSFREGRKKYLRASLWIPYAVIAGLLILCGWQESQIADLQERMMNVESSRYDEQLNDIRWEAETALRKTRGHDGDIYRLEDHSADLQFRVMEMEWDLYGREGMAKQHTDSEGTRLPVRP
jgi:hypothetical protein